MTSRRGSLLVPHKSPELNSPGAGGQQTQPPVKSSLLSVSVPEVRTVCTYLNDWEKKKSREVYCVAHENYIKLNPRCPLNSFTATQQHSFLDSFILKHYLQLLLHCSGRVERGTYDPQNLTHLLSSHSQKELSEPKPGAGGQQTQPPVKSSLLSVSVPEVRTVCTYLNDWKKKSQGKYFVLHMKIT